LDGACCRSDSRGLYMSVPEVISSPSTFELITLDYVAQNLERRVSNMETNDESKSTA